MHDNNHFLKSIEFSYYHSICNQMLHYIEKHIHVPNHVYFNMSKQEYKAFEDRVFSKEAKLSDYKKLISFYSTLQVNNLLKVYTDYFGDELPF